MDLPDSVLAVPVDLAQWCVLAVPVVEAPVAAVDRVAAVDQVAAAVEGAARAAVVDSALRV